MEKRKLSMWRNIGIVVDAMHENRRLFFLTLFAAALLFRLPALFNDYYDVDVLTTLVATKEYLLGAVPGVDFKENKRFLYHLLFKGSYLLCPEYGWSMVHFFTAVIIYLTSIFIYLTGSLVSGRRIGILAAFLYAILISSFNRHFMASNGEVIYNLPLAAGLYFFCLFLKNLNLKGGFYLASALVCSYLAFSIKFQGLMLLIFLIVFMLVYMPYYYKGLRFTLMLGAGAVVLLLLDWFFAGIVVRPVLDATGIIGKLSYSAAEVRAFTFFDFIVRFAHRQAMLSLWHMVVWIPAFVYIAKFASRRFRGEDAAGSAVAVFFIFTYLTVFGGGARLYFHYFMVPYISGSIIASIVILDVDSIRLQWLKKRAVVLIAVPALFFLSWNTKDVIIRNFFPQAFYGEGRVLYWARAVLVGTFDDYLLPHGSYLDVVNYIKDNSSPDDRIFVWGDGAYLYYFSGRRPAIFHMWPKNSIFRIMKAYQSGDESAIKSAMQDENKFIDLMKKNRPVFIIDTSGNGLSLFTMPISVAPHVYNYVTKEYVLAAERSKMAIYIRKDLADINNH